MKLDSFEHRVQTNQKRDLKGDQKTLFTNFAVRYGKICYDLFMKMP